MEHSVKVGFWENLPAMGYRNGVHVIFWSVYQAIENSQPYLQAIVTNHVYRIELLKAIG